MKSTIRLASHKKYWYSDDNIILSKQLSEYFLDSERDSQYNSLKSIIVPIQVLDMVVLLQQRLSLM